MKPLATLLLLSFAACAGLPEFTPGVTRRADVLLALGEPLLTFAEDSVMVHMWLASTALHMVRPEALYDLRASGEQVQRAPAAAQDVARLFHFVVHEFDRDGLLIRRLP